MPVSLPVNPEFGRYRLLRSIGHGGMGSVYEARQTDLDRLVAVKVMRSELVQDAEFRTRFTREARVLASLDSPHIIQVYDFGEQDGHLFMVTQLVHGGDLQTRLKDTEGLPIREAVAVVRQVAEALDDAHGHGLLHRDIKPSNVLLRAGRTTHAYLCDFGIARSIATTGTATAGVLGTVGYMAPERHRGANASVASDVYSLGCVLWAAVSGKAPYASTTDVGLALKHLTEDIPQLRGEDAESRTVNSVLRRSMAKDPTHRFDSAGDLCRALERIEGSGAPYARTGGAATQPATSFLSTAPLTRVQQPPPVTTTRNPLWLIGGMLVAGAILTVTGITVASGAPDTPGQSDGPSAVVASRTPVVTKIPDVVAGAAEPDRTAADTPAPVVEPPPSPAVPPDAGQSAPEAGHSLAAPGPTPRPTRAPSVTCWDGSSTSAAAACPLPVGRTGLASVFPSLDSSCLRARHATVPGKNEVFECDYGTFVVRYSRWDVGADRLAYYRQANPGATELPWNAAGQPAGRQWWSFEEGPETLKRQWSATYADHPFSVSVEGIDQAARVDGVQLVRRVAPHLVGLARRNG